MKLLDIIKNRKYVKPRVIYVDAQSTRKPVDILPFVFQLALLYISLTGFVYCITTSVQSDIPFWVVALIALPAIIIAGLFTINTKVYIAFLSAFALFSASVFFVFTSLAETIIDSFTFCFNKTIQIVIDEGYTNYKNFLTEDISHILDNQDLVNKYYYCVMIVLVVLFSVIFTLSMMKRSIVWLCTLPCFIFLTPSLYFGAVPSGIAFAIFLSGIIGCYVESISHFSLRKNKKNNKEKKEKKFVLFKPREKGDKKDKVNRFLKSTALTGFSNALLVLVVSLTVSVFVYSSDLMRLDKLRKVIDDIAVRIMNTLFYEQYETAEGAIGGLIENDTLELDVPEFRELPVMNVTTRTGTTLYLRGWIGKELGQEGWSVLNDKDTASLHTQVSPDFNSYTQFYNFMSLMSKEDLSNAQSGADTEKLGFIYDTVDIKSKFSKSLMAFLPVTGIDGKIMGDYKGLKTVGDTIVFFKQERPEKNTYTVKSALQSFVSSDFYITIKENQQNYLKYAATVPLNKTNPTPSEKFVIDERKYSEYVKRTYLTVPDNSDYFKNIAQEAAGKYVHNFDKALSVERYLKTDYKYSIEASIPKGTALERIQYVLENGKEGYCTYYASAMTIMMRHLGIPARYVIGYYSEAMTDSDTQEFERKIVDNDYHAWVEVYIEGIGWLTFDPTPGYGDNAPVRDYQYLDNPDTMEPETPEEPEEQPDETPDETEPTPPVVQQQQQQQQQEQQQQQGSEVENVPGPAEDEPEKTPSISPVVYKTVFSIVGILIAIAVIVVLFIYLLKYINLRYDNMFNAVMQTDRTDMVRKLYPKILSLLHGLGYNVETGELVGEFAKRVDSEIDVNVKLAMVISYLEMSHFSKNEVSLEQSKAVFLYFVNISDFAMKKFNVFKKYYYKIKLGK